MSIPGWTRIYSGKVRDLFVPTTFHSPYGHEIVLVVASDRISAFDYVLRDQVPDKGKYLTFLSEWWFRQLSGVVPHHFISAEVPDEVRGYAMLTSRLQMYPIECTVRGYLSANVWDEYRETGMVCGNKLPSGLALSEKLSTPIFCPSLKAPIGERDKNISFDMMVERVGADNAEVIRQYALDVYKQGANICAEKGLILADTKLEFGAASDVGEDLVVLGDEVLTPDSSHYWFADEYQVGKKATSFDKELIRSWLLAEKTMWNPKSRQIPPTLPAEIIEEMRKRYIRVVETITGMAVAENI